MLEKSPSNRRKIIWAKVVGALFALAAVAAILSATTDLLGLFTGNDAVGRSPDSEQSTTVASSPSSEVDASATNSASASPPGEVGPVDPAATPAPSDASATSEPPIAPTEAPTGGARFDSVAIKLGDYKYAGDDTYVLGGAGRLEIHASWTTYTSQGELEGKCLVTISLRDGSTNDLLFRATGTACSLAPGFVSTDDIRQPGTYRFEVHVDGPGDIVGSSTRTIKVTP